MGRDEDLTPTLIYWIAIAAVGFIAALGSSITGWRYYRALRQHYPKQAQSYWPEVVRDQLLVIGLAGNLLVGVIAINPGPIRDGLGLVGILAAATCLSLFAIFNFVLRAGR